MMIDPVSNRTFPADQGVSLPALSDHARRRCDGRRLTRRALILAMKHGLRVQQDGAVVYFLGRRHLDGLPLSAQEKERLEGVTLVVSRDGTVVTVWKNRRGVAGSLRRRGTYRGRRPTGGPVGDVSREQVSALAGQSPSAVSPAPARRKVSGLSGVL